MNSARENKWNRKPSPTPTKTEVDFFRVVAQNEGDQEEAERLYGKQLDAEKIEAGKVAFLADWTLEVFTARRAKWNAATGNFAEREKATKIKFADLMLAKNLHGIK